MSALLPQTHDLRWQHVLDHDPIFLVREHYFEVKKPTPKLLVCIHSGGDQEAEQMQRQLAALEETHAQLEEQVGSWHCH